MKSALDTLIATNGLQVSVSPLYLPASGETATTPPT